MLAYQDLYEHLRKEKYSEQLQNLSKDFVVQFSEYCVEKKKQFSVFDGDGDMYSDDILREKKQFENAFALFKELMMRRKRKILNLVFVAAETGIMKKDFTDMLSFERDLFEKLLKSVDEGDKALTELLNGKKEESGSKMIIISEDIEKFVDMDGRIVGPFRKGNLVNINRRVADVLVGGEKATFVDAEN
jgi:DNA replication initiation complex subunit (GINS family)